MLEAPSVFGAGCGRAERRVCAFLLACSLNLQHGHLGVCGAVHRTGRSRHFRFRLQRTRRGDATGRRDAEARASLSATETGAAAHRLGAHVSTTSSALGALRYATPYVLRVGGSWSLLFASPASPVIGQGLHPASREAACQGTWPRWVHRPLSAGDACATSVLTGTRDGS